MSELAISGDHIITPAEQISGVPFQVSKSEGLPVPSKRIAAKELEKAYGVIRIMSHTLFRLPMGRAGNGFLDEMTRVLIIYTKGTHGSQNALYALFILPAIMLQKPSKNSQTKDNVNALQRRFELWCEGNVRELIKECKLLQKRLSKGNSNTSETTILRNFIIAVRSGNVGVAGKLIDGTTSSSLELTPDVINQLKTKHPPAEPTNPESLIKSTPESVPESLLAELTGESIRTVALKCSGGAGPSRLKAQGSKRIL